jgi:glycosyltransferase involved in cell wall biosynthesis
VKKWSGAFLINNVAKTKVYLMGGDGVGWALDSDLLQLRRALDGIVEFTDLDNCEVIHSVWWEPLVEIPITKLRGKRIICQLSGEPFRYLNLPLFSRALSKVGLWISQSTEARNQLESIGIQSVTIPYTVDLDVFRPIVNDDLPINVLRSEWGLPADCFLVGNFHRDTEGHDLTSPKLVKGPDIFVEIASALKRRGVPVHVLLAGPRRMWMRKELTRLEIPFSYIGEPLPGDDIKSNMLSHETLNRLYNLLDLYLISSRSEGGPRTLLEALAVGCPVFSTRVGIASDILPPECLYSTVCEAADKIEENWRNKSDREMMKRVQERLTGRHTVPAVIPLLKELYDKVLLVQPFTAPVKLEPKSQPRDNGWLNKIVSFGTNFLPSSYGTFTVGLWHKYFTPPYGGGNQFMLALRKELQRCGVTIRENRLSEEVDAYVLNSIHFDVEQFLDFSVKHRTRVLHRIDGPIHLIRGYDREKDELCFQLNMRFAAATVVQSRWTLQRILEMGYQPVNPVIIHNSVDAEIFHPLGRINFDPGRKIRLISSSWSDNARKGGPVYKWIEKHLDWDRFEYTFVGNASETFARIRHLAPVQSSKLAHLLRQHDIFITASSNDPCSNAVIEALACGLPVLYLNDGGHPELVGYGGLPFNSNEEILPQLDNLVETYTVCQNLIVVPTMEEVTAKYLQLLKEISSNDQF